MEYRRLGRTDLRVSALSFGTMVFGDQRTEAEGHRMLDMAFERGVNLYDTAELYPIPPKAETQGATDRILGSWIRARGNRDRVLVASKVVGRSENTWFRDGRPANLSRDHVREAVDKGLTRLGLDHIDLFQVHWPDRAVSQFGSNPTIYRAPEPAPDEVPIEETLEALTELQREGKIGHVGLSNESAWGTMRYLALSETKGLARVQSIQNAYSLVNRTFEVALAEIAMREEVGLLAYSVLAQGYLTGKYLDGALPAGSRKALYDRLQRYEKPGSEAAVRAYVELAREEGIPPSQLAIRFALTRPFMTSVIIGASTPEQLSTDLDAADLPWRAELEERVDQIHLLHQNPSP
ncbi:aldo/keto reductase [Lutibaculum baratangense]|uniref:Oxidoreductase, aldo/keto reductase family n=1 Tax=Lutibaculum baratangense AMV1 TaxID=631454 RepID=V4RL40_9HYPH|nr:aldo/keto reductase [Lutibaculum baratangense]ESR26019.1 Oxidoreductase, aldo/keto reductase family [Lutibaculum baratangense AMV1]